MQRFYLAVLLVIFATALTGRVLSPVRTLAAPLTPRVSALAPYERAQYVGRGVTIYYLDCQQATWLQRVAGSIDGVMTLMGFVGKPFPFIFGVTIGWKLLQALGFNNLSSQTIAAANAGCHGVRLGVARIGPIVVAMLVARR